MGVQDSHLNWFNMSIWMKWRMPNTGRGCKRRDGTVSIVKNDIEMTESKRTPAMLHQNFTTLSLCTTIPPVRISVRNSVYHPSTKPPLPLLPHRPETQRGYLYLKAAIPLSREALTCLPMVAPTDATFGGSF